ncbi:hypothetical protein [Isoptericola rhizosphaerae]|uniref:hypothetical protein n=1 Tax=Isoptericola rhizosphaerae TaxID=3377837 RepID=UPI00383A078D
MATSSKVAARERARAARLRIDRDRAERDRRVEEAAASYFLVVEKRDELDRRAGQSVDELLDLGLAQRRIAELLDVDAREVRRLRSIARPNTDGVRPPGDDGSNDVADVHQP